MRALVESTPQCAETLAEHGVHESGGKLRERPEHPGPCHEIRMR